MQRGAYDDVTDITKYFSEQFDKWFPWLKSYEFLSKVPTYEDAKPEILQQKRLKYFHKFVQTSQQRIRIKGDYRYPRIPRNRGV